VGPGEVGEVAVTTLNPDYPLIRFATGDLSMLLPGASPCGRTAPRLKGWMGRADQTTKVRGMFVHPSQVAEIARRHPAIGRCRLVVGREGANDTMELRAEVAAADRGDGLAAAIAASCLPIPAPCPTTARRSMIRAATADRRPRRRAIPRFGHDASVMKPHSAGTMLSMDAATSRRRRPKPVSPAGASRTPAPAAPVAMAGWPAARPARAFAARRAWSARC
jgi:hypothetical protein